MKTATTRQGPHAGPFASAGFDPQPWDGAARMQADAAAFAEAEARAAGGHVVTPRFAWWMWERPTISLGRLQRGADAVDGAAAAAAGIPVVVRPTGGRAILHAAEWTYSALVPLDHPHLGGPRDASTRAIVGLVGRALAAAFDLAFDAPAPDRAIGGAAPAGDAAACFARAFGYELAIGGRKLMGSAQRRGRHVLLQQGSLLVGAGHERLGLYLVGAPDQRRATCDRLAAAAITLDDLVASPPDRARFAEAFDRVAAPILAPPGARSERSS